MNRRPGSPLPADLDDRILARGVGKFETNAPEVDVRSLLRDRKRSLEEWTRPGVLFEDSGEVLRCSACAHRCVLKDGSTGVCGVRVRRGKELLVPYGYVARSYVRPVETNTIFHVRPGTRALTFGMYGCDLRCPYCHNHQLSQALREPAATVSVHAVTPRALVEEALTADCSTICSAYNEPLITAEWAHAVFSEGRRAGLLTAVISDGHATPEALHYLRPVTDVFRIDLKGFDESQYRSLGGRLQPVLDTIALAKALGFWVEVVTLVVPGFNQDARGLGWLGDALRAIDPSIPWHLDAFQPRYKMRDLLPPPPAALMSVAGTAYARGSEFVYVGNVPTESLAATRCPGCHDVAIERRDWQATKVSLVNGCCARCERPPAGQVVTPMTVSRRCTPL